MVWLTVSFVATTWFKKRYCELKCLHEPCWDRRTQQEHFSYKMAHHHIKCTEPHSQSNHKYVSIVNCIRRVSNIVPRYCSTSDCIKSTYFFFFNSCFVHSMQFWGGWVANQFKLWIGWCRMGSDILCMWGEVIVGVATFMTVCGLLMHSFHLFGMPLGLTHVCYIGGGQVAIVNNAKLMAELIRWQMMNYFASRELSNSNAWYVHTQEHIWSRSWVLRKCLWNSPLWSTTLPHHLACH